MVNRLTQTTQPAIVIAGNDMYSSRRIVNYLKAMLGDPRHDVLFVGYQARGVPAHVIQRFGPGNGYVAFDGQRYEIRAGVHSIGGYSAHASQTGLVGSVTAMQQWPEKIRLVHAEARGKATLASEIQKEYSGRYLSINIHCVEDDL